MRTHRQADLRTDIPIADPGAGEDCRAGEAGDARERAWLRGIRLGQVSAFEQIYRAYAGRLTRLARRCFWPEDAAQDLVHEVFLRVWRGRATLDIHTNLGAYLSAAVRHEAAAAGRRRGSERGLVARCASTDETPGMGERPLDAAEDLERDELRRELAAAIARLPKRARVIAHMRWIERRSRGEIAGLLGISVATVNNQLTVAMRATRKRVAHLRP